MNALDHRSFDDGGDDLQLAVAVRAVLDIPTKRQEAASRQRRFLADSDQLRAPLRRTATAALLRLSLARRPPLGSRAASPAHAAEKSEAPALCGESSSYHNSTLDVFEGWQSLQIVVGLHDQP